VPDRVEINVAMEIIVQSWARTASAIKLVHACIARRGKAGTERKGRVTVEGREAREGLGCYSAKRPRPTLGLSSVSGSLLFQRERRM